MGTVYHSRNGKLNAGLRGLERGLTNGIALGQRSRIIGNEEEQQQFYEQQVLRKAQLADQELSREENARKASAQAAAEMTKDVKAIPAAGRGGTGRYGAMSSQAAGAHNDIQFKQQLDRVGQIAQRMAANGVPMEQVMAFVEKTKARHKQIKDQAERTSLVNETSRGVAAGSYFTQQPNGDRVETPEMHGLLSTWSQLAADPNTPIEALREQRGRIDREQIKSKAVFENVRRTVEQLKSKIGQGNEMQQPGMQGPQAPSESKRTQKQDMLLSAYEHKAPMLMGGDPRKWAEFEQDWWHEWDMAEHGIAYYDRNNYAVSYQDEEGRRVMEQQLMQAETAQRQASAQYDLGQGRQPMSVGGKSGSGLTDNEALTQARQILGEVATPDEVRTLAEQLKANPLGSGGGAGAPQGQLPPEQQRLQGLMQQSPDLIEKVRRGELPSDPKLLAAILRGDKPAPATQGQPAPTATKEAPPNGSDDTALKSELQGLKDELSVVQQAYPPSQRKARREEIQARIDELEAILNKPIKPRTPAEGQASYDERVQRRAGGKKRFDPLEKLGG